MAFTTLLTSVGRRVELVRLFRDAYARLGIEGRIVATDLSPLAPALAFVDKGYITPRVSDAGYLGVLEEIVAREGANLIFPLIDPEIPVLAAQRERLEARGAKLGVSPLKAVRISESKWSTWEFFKGLGLPVPRSWIANEMTDSELEEACAGPLFLKPDHGSSSVDTFKIRNRRELEFFRDYVPNAIVQEWLPGPEVTTDVICGLQGGVLSTVQRQRIRTRGGEVSVGLTIRDEEIDIAVRRIAEALDARGPICVQCIYMNGRPHYTEINARFGGGFPLGVAAGSQGVVLLVADAAGIPVKVDELAAYKVGVSFLRYDESVFISQNDLARNYEVIAP